MAQNIVGVIPDIMSNWLDLYLGNLEDYFLDIIENAQNLQKGYHNFGHMFHVTFQCHDACYYYRDMMSSRKMRNLLIAAMFHDFDHPGMMGNDDLNVERAIRGFIKFIQPEDRDFQEDIAQIIRATEFPYRVKSAELPPASQIIRDADMAQCFAPAWVQQVIFGLGQEWNKKPIDIFRGQISFLQGIEFCTDWGKKKFSPEVVEAKIVEVEKYIRILEKRRKK